MQLVQSTFKDTISPCQAHDAQCDPRIESAGDHAYADCQFHSQPTLPQTFCFTGQEPINTYYILMGAAEMRMLAE